VANILWIISQIDLVNLVDILLVAAVIYAVLLLVRGTQAVQLLRGVILLALFVALVGSLAGLAAFNWLVRSSGQFLAVVVAIVLQPELRRALERLGRAGGVTLWLGREAELDRTIGAVVAASRRMSERRHGALIVIERDTGLQDYVDTGVEIDSLVADELLQTVFYPSTALHDGAVILRGDRIVAAACVLPLAEAIISDRHLGTRHRAAVGITEQTDAIAIVV
jgi:diadenylate cyclase